MKQIKSIKLKAAFLLMVFALNTVIAFACSMGLNLGYNKKHHHSEHNEGASTRSHYTSIHHQHDKAASHQHNDAANHHDEQEKPGKDDCCNKTAVQFQQVDKSFSHAGKIEISTPVILLRHRHENSIHVHSSNIAANMRYHFVPPDHPPSSDIRVAIRSFQI